MHYMGYYYLKYAVAEAFRVEQNGSKTGLKPKKHEIREVKKRTYGIKLAELRLLNNIGLCTIHFL